MRSTYNYLDILYKWGVRHVDTMVQGLQSEFEICERDAKLAVIQWLKWNDLHVGPDD